MAGVKEFTVGVSHTVNLGDYEFMRVEAEGKVGADAEGEYVEWTELRKTAQEALTQLLSETFQAQKKPAWFAQIPRKRSNL